MITQVPEFPLRSQGLTQSEYSAGVEASLSAMPTFIDELNAVGSAYALSTNGTSVSSVTIGTGSKSFTTQIGLGYMVGMTLRIANSSLNYMTGEVTSYNSGTGALVMNITSVAGSGTLASWTITMGAVGDLASKANISGQTFTGDVLVPDEAYDASAWNANLEVPTKNAIRDKIESLSKAYIQDIDAFVSANALTITINPTVLDFRSTTLTDGTPATVALTSAVTVVVPNTATLGTTNNVAARLAVIAINNAGTIEAAVVNLAGGNQLDETNLISTTTVSTGADSANVIYSTTGRSTVAYRVLGFIDITEASAGVWATAPTLVQGSGGNAMTALSSLGYGQTWQNVTGSRSFSTTFYNTTGKPIVVSVVASCTTSTAMTLVVGGINVSTFQGGNVSAIPGTVQAIVPPGVAYSLTVTGVPGLSIWSELR
jgi:hypothetical protein